MWPDELNDCDRPLAEQGEAERDSWQSATQVGFVGADNYDCCPGEREERRNRQVKR